jgi:hypothetical protein
MRVFFTENRVSSVLALPVVVITVSWFVCIPKHLPILVLKGSQETAYLCFANFSVVLSDVQNEMETVLTDE